MQEARTCNFTFANFSLHHLMVTFSATSQITFKRFTEEFPGRSLQIWRQLQVFALFRRAVRNVASVENEVPFKPKITETCVSSKKNAICHDAMFCRPAAPASIESNEFEHPQRVDSKSDRGLSGFALLPLGPVSPR